MLDGGDAMAQIYDDATNDRKAREDRIMVQNLPEDLQHAYYADEFFRRVFESKKRYIEVLQEPIHYFYEKQPHLFDICDVNLVDTCIRFSNDYKLTEAKERVRKKAMDTSPEIMKIIREVDKMKSTNVS